MNGTDEMSDETEKPGPDASPEAGDETGEAAGAPAEAAPAPPEPDAAPAGGGAASPEELAARLAEMRDSMLRAAAEADNTRKRAEREVADARIYAVTSFARDLLSVNDNLARALEALTPEMREGMREAGRTLLDGIEMTQKELHTVLARHGVEPIAATPGDAFDPNVHQAAAQIPSEQPQGAIVEVMQGGWRIGDRVLRAAMVAVSAGAPAAPPAPASPAGGDAGGAPPGSSVDTQV